jgi:outer membrane protein OmpA-like peptidoglycan-associated protein
VSKTRTTSAPQGSFLTPFLVFGGIVGLSVLFFFLLTLPTWLERGPRAPSGADGAVTVAAAVPKTLVNGEGKAVPKPRGAGPVKRAYFPDAASLLSEFGRLLADGRVEEGMQLAGEAGKSPGAGFLRHLLGGAGYRVAAEAERWRKTGSASGMSRHQLVLAPGEAGVPPLLEFPELDLRREGQAGWRIQGFRIGARLAAAGAERLRVRNVVLDGEALRMEADALGAASEFLSSLIGRDFRRARQLTSPGKVAHEKLAGLCIVFEEGGYRADTDHPVTVTAENGGRAWAITKVRPAEGGSESEIGIELQCQADGAWLVESVDFSRLLEAYVKATGAGTVFYAPIVRSPSGGESIVIYFEFDRSGLHPRAVQQLEIVAALLKSDPARKLRITGHADDVGADEYNYRLSHARAAAVRERLALLGVAASQIETIGFGATAPLDPNRLDDGGDNPVGRSRNRRTEIHLDF